MQALDGTKSASGQGSTHQDVLEVRMKQITNFMYAPPVLGGAIFVSGRPTSTEASETS